VPLSIWYDWKNDGDDPNENEHNFGTVMPNLKPKPAYVAISTLTDELTGFHIVRRLQLDSDKDYALLCADAAGNQKLAAWTLAEPHMVTIDTRLPKDPAGAKDNEESFTPKLVTGKVVFHLLELTTTPQYVNLDQAILRLAIPR
jgi:hypothetical protein